MKKFLEDLDGGFEAQTELTSVWHERERDMNAEYESIMASPYQRDLVGAITTQHFMNYSLWHIEDRARRRDVPAEVIAECKHRIDVFNQKRNNLIEKIDEAVANAMAPHMPPDAAKKYNTETLGMAVDRMSIMALKIFHMREQTQRTDAGDEHINRCAEKLSQLTEQRIWLRQSIFELIDDLLAGRKSLRGYFQHKMYNDKNLNPELYMKP